MKRRVPFPENPLGGRVFARAAVMLALAAACAVGGASPALADGVEPAWRAIVLKGASVPQLLGGPESHLEVLALRGGHLAPIPFQVDEVLPDGRYALTEGPEPLADDSPGILDRDDEIVMMLSDLGDRASPPPAGLPASALEIEAEDAATHALRYAYVAAVASPRLSPVSYVAYDPARSRVDGGSYRMTFRGDFPIGLALSTSRGGFSPSLIEGAQVQVGARVLKLFKLRLDASGVANAVTAWHRGPVRLIRRASHSMKLLRIESPRVFSDEIFYRDYAEDSFAARVPWLPRLFFDDVQVRTWLDFVGVEDFALAWRPAQWHALAPEPQRAALAAELRDGEPEVKWLALRGGGRIVMQTFTPSPDFETLRRRLYYCNGTVAAEKSEQASSCDSSGPQIGYLMTGWESLAAGTHRVDSILMVLPDGAEPDAVARELAAPPVVKVRPARP